MADWARASGAQRARTLPLGYDLPAPGSRALVVNPDEAALVRYIFGRYLRLNSVHAPEHQLREEGIVSMGQGGTKSHASSS